MEELNETIVETIEETPVTEGIEAVSDDGSGNGIGILVGAGVAVLGVLAFKKLKPVLGKGVEKFMNRRGYYKMSEDGTIEVEAEVVEEDDKKDSKK